MSVVWPVTQPKQSNPHRITRSPCMLRLRLYQNVKQFNDFEVSGVGVVSRRNFPTYALCGFQRKTFDSPVNLSISCNLICRAHKTNRYYLYSASVRVANVQDSTIEIGTHEPTSRLASTTRRFFRRFGKTKLLKKHVRRTHVQCTVHSPQMY